MKLPFQIDLNDKVVVITGAGGLICSAFAEAMAMCGAKVALLDLNEEAAKKYADEIPSGLAEQITNIAQYLEQKSAD